MTDRPLTLRKWEILSRLVLGRSYKRIAFELGIAERTVKLHVRQIAGRYPDSDCGPLRTVLAHAPALLAARVAIEADAA